MGISSIKSRALFYWKNKRIRQVFLLFSVNIASIPIGIITSIILSRYLGPNGFGDYQFLNNIFSFCIPVFVFGFFKSRITGINPWLGALRVTLIGALAAGAAFGVAKLFEL